MNTKVYRLEKRPNELYFTNYDRAPENELFLHVSEVLRSCDDIEIKEKEFYPVEDIYPCKMGKKEFSLVYDIDYGPFIHSNDKNVLDRIAKLFD